MKSIQIRSKTANDNEWAKAFLNSQSNNAHLPAFSEETSHLSLPAWIAEVDDEPVGLLMYDFQNGACNIISLHVSRKRIGVGESLLNRLEVEAKSKSCKEITCAVGNDNLNALRFLQKRGFHLVELRVGAIEARRKLHPAVPITGEYGIPLRDELVLAKKLNYE